MTAEVEQRALDTAPRVPQVERRVEVPAPPARRPAAARGPRRGLDRPAGGADRRHVHVRAGQQHRQRGDPGHPDRAERLTRLGRLGGDRLHARARRRRPAFRVAGHALRAGPPLRRVRARFRGGLRAVRAGLEPRLADRLPHPAGDTGRGAPRHHADDAVPDRPAEEHRRRDGALRPRRRRRPRGGADAGRVPRRVHRLAGDLLHQRADRHTGRRARAGGVAPRARRPAGRSSTCGASSRSPTPCSRCCSPSRRGRAGDGRAIASSSSSPRR